MPLLSFLDVSLGGAGCGGGSLSVEEIGPPVVLVVQHHVQTVSVTTRGVDGVCEGCVDGVCSVVIVVQDDDYFVLDVERVCWYN